MPGQALAYLVGMQKILDLRTRAREQLGTSFDSARISPRGAE